MTWRDVMPAIQFARGVPFVTPAGGWGLAADIAPSGFAFHDELGAIQSADHAMDCHRAIIDLSDAGGFGYALRWLMRDGVSWASLLGGERAATSLIFRHMYDETTDEDRLALARALREVVA